VEFIGNSYSELIGEILGPSGTPYEGGTFFLKIDALNNYPFCPPKVSIIFYSFITFILFLMFRFNL